MFKLQETPDDTCIMEDGVVNKPVATLKHEAGYVAHIVQPEGSSCYSLCVETGGWASAEGWPFYYTTSWFPEAIEALKTLPGPTPAQDPEFDLTKRVVEHVTVEVSCRPKGEDGKATDHQGVAVHLAAEALRRSHLKGLAIQGEERTDEKISMFIVMDVGQVLQSLKRIISALDSVVGAEPWPYPKYPLAQVISDATGTACAACNSQSCVGECMHKKKVPFVLKEERHPAGTICTICGDQFCEHLGNACTKKMRVVADTQPRVLGCILLTDDAKLVQWAKRLALAEKGRKPFDMLTRNELHSRDGRTRTQRLQEEFDKEFPGLMRAAVQARKQCDEKRLMPHEIQIFDGRVRVMASQKYGRLDGGWVDIEPERWTCVLFNVKLETDDAELAEFLDGVRLQDLAEDHGELEKMRPGLLKQVQSALAAIPTRYARTLHFLDGKVQAKAIVPPIESGIYHLEKGSS